MANKTNNNILFGDVCWRYPVLTGFTKKTSGSYRSAYSPNSAKQATLYRPALKALILSLCDGRKVWDQSLDKSEIYGPEGAVGALAVVGDIAIAEYRFSEDETHIAAFNMSQNQFIWAGITKDSGASYSPYILDYDGGRNATVMWLALIPYLSTSSKEMESVFDELKTIGSKVSLSQAYEEIVDGKSETLPKHVRKQCFIFCDNVYYRVGRENYADALEIGTPCNTKSFTFPMVPASLESYVPAENEIWCGYFTIEGLGTIKQPTSKAKKAKYTNESIHCMYALNDNMSDEEKAAAQKMGPEYVVPKWVVKAAHNIKYNHDLDTPSAMKQNNLLLIGPPGTGKSEGAKAIASALGLKATHISMSANSDEFVFSGSIIPDVSSIKKDNSSATDDFIVEGYQDVNDILDSAKLAPEIVYQDVTGEEKPDATTGDVVMALAERYAKFNSAQPNGGVQYKFVTSEFIEAMKNGYLVTIEEATNVRDPGVMIFFNALSDGYQEIVLPTGEHIERNPNTVVVFASNVDEANCNEFEASLLSRLKPIYRIEAPGKAELISRVKKMTGFDDEYILNKMADVCEQLAKYIQTHALVGVCGVREFAGWVQQYRANKEFEPNLSERQLLKESALETIVPTASPHKVDMDDVTRDIIDIFVV